MNSCVEWLYISSVCFSFAYIKMNFKSAGILRMIIYLRDYHHSIWPHKVHVWQIIYKLQSLSILQFTVSYDINLGAILFVDSRLRWNIGSIIVLPFQITLPTCICFMCKVNVCIALWIFFASYIAFLNFGKGWN